MARQALTMSHGSKAVFLSYASQDAEAARRICDALRTAGVEVWFDQSELRGGDAWDAKIRKEIKECALFVPIISARTEARGEGYFRLEWKLADERTALIAKGLPFLLPLAIDDTIETDALVPDSFRAVQWMRMRGSASAESDHAAFIAQVRRLLSSRAASSRARSGPAARSEVKPIGAVAAPRGTRKVAAILLGGALLVLLGGAIAFFALRNFASPATISRSTTAATPVGATPPAVPSNKSIAILPFTNLSPNRENEFFADGVLEEIIGNLQSIRALRVVSRTSVMEYRDSSKKAGVISRELGATYLLRGSVRREGNRVRVNAQLIDARSDENVWSSKPYDRELSDIFAIQSEIAEAIVTALRAVLSPQEKSILERRPTTNLAAYDLYLKARALRFQNLGNGLPARTFRQVEPMLQRAVELDPGFAPAWAELAYAYTSGALRDPEKSKAALEVAQRLAPETRETLFAQAAYFYHGLQDYERAAEAYTRLTQERPGDAEAFNRLGAVRRRQARWSEALPNLRQAVDLDPRNDGFLRILADVLTGGRRYDEAAAHQLRVVGLLPGSLNDGFTLAQLSFFARGSTREMEEWLAQAPAAQSDLEQWNVMRGRWLMLRGDFAGRIQLAETNPDDAVSLDVAIALAAVGKREAARILALAQAEQIQVQVAANPKSPQALRQLAVALAVANEREAALAAREQALKLQPESTDRMTGARARESMIFVLAWVGETDRAIAELALSLRTPFGAKVQAWRHGAGGVPLRGDPRFEALLNDPKNNAPLF